MNPKPPHKTPEGKLTRRQWFRRAGVSAAGVAVSPHLIEAAAKQRPVSVPHAPAANGLVRLSSNENPYGPSANARAAMTAAYDEACRYPYAGASDDLTEAIAEKEGVSVDHVLIGCGSGEILAMTGMAYGMDSGELIAADPTYQGMLRYAERIGGYVHRVPLDEDLVHDLEAMERRITLAARLVFICNPNNPTGTIVDPVALRDFCTSVAKRAVVFMDEAYIDLLEDPAEHTMIDLVLKGHNVIVSRTFSKIHGLAGMRIGYAIARPDIIQRIARYRMGSPNVLGLRAAIASYQDAEFQAFSRNKIAEGREKVYDALDHAGYVYVPSYGSFVFFHTGTPIQEFQEDMMTRNILVGRPFPPYLDWCRVSIGTSEDMNRFVTAFQGMLADKS